MAGYPRSGQPGGTVRLQNERAGGPGTLEHCERPEGGEAQLMAADSLTAGRPFTGSSKAQNATSGS